MDWWSRDGYGYSWLVSVVLTEQVNETGDRALLVELPWGKNILGRHKGPGAGSGLVSVVK